MIIFISFTVPKGGDTTRQKGPSAVKNWNAHIGQKLHHRPDKDHMWNEGRTGPIQGLAGRIRWCSCVVLSRRKHRAIIVCNGGNSGGCRNRQTATISTTKLRRINGSFLISNEAAATIITINPPQPPSSNRTYMLTFAYLYVKILLNVFWLNSSQFSPFPLCQRLIAHWNTYEYVFVN